MTVPDAAIAQVATTEHLLLALDVDGTLAPLMDDPMAVRIIPAARAALDRLAARDDTTVAFVSGRALDALRIITEHSDDSPIFLAASHGAESWAPGRVGAQQTDEPEGLAEIRAAADAAVAGIPRAWIEQKTLGLAVHTRGALAADAERAQAAVAALMARVAPGWRGRVGKDVQEYSWRHEGKDAAIARLRRETGATAVLFAGDDVTDEDAMGSLQPHDLGVRVGGGQTAATIRVDTPDDLARLLDVIASLRTSEAQ